MRALALLAFVAWTLAACATVRAPSVDDSADAPITIVIAERGPGGLRLVAIDESGDRRFTVVAEPATPAADSSPAISPDGKWIVFASRRERQQRSGTSLWIAPLGREMQPRRITAGDWIDSHPTWSPDGESIVFASTREGGDFDLWRLPLRSGAPTPDGARQLTHGDGHEVAPSVAPDGRIAYAVVELRPGDDERRVVSHLELLASDGTIAPLTAGTTDGSPAFSPDGQWLAYVSAHDNGTVVSADVFVRPVRELLANPAASSLPVVMLPPSDEDNPTWSRDGRYLFASSIVWGERGVLASSVIVVDTQERPAVARVLIDHVGATPRITPAIGVAPLTPATLARNSSYLPRLMQTLQRAIEKQQAVEQAP